MNEIVNNEPEEIKETIQDQFFGIKNDVVSEAPEVELINENIEDSIERLQVEPSEQAQESVGNEIDNIRNQYDSERKAKEAALGAEREAVAQLKGLMEENQRLNSFVHQGSDVLNQQALNNAQWALHSAQQELTKAYDEGDSEAIGAAQAKISKAAVAEQQSGQYANMVMQRASQNLPPIKEPAIKKQQLDPDMQAWSDKNPWFMNNGDPTHQRMTSYAMYLDQEVRGEGTDPTTNAVDYYAKIDKEMKLRFPNFFGVQPQATEVVETYSKQPASVVAPTTRSNGKKPRKVSLSKDQIRVARQLNISPQAYAAQYLKLEEG